MLTLATLAAPAIATADEPAADTANLPGHIVNGDFEYPGWKTLIGSSSADWTSVTRDGASLNRDTANSWMRIPGFDADSFAWTSSQTYEAGNVERRAGAVELQRETSTGNTYAEIIANQAGAAIYQDINTSGGPAMYKVRLRHTSQTSRYLDRMSVLVGTPDNPEPLLLTRVTSNGNGDKTGETSTVIATKASNDSNSCLAQNPAACSARNHEGQWEWYEGYVTIPKGQDVTRFSFKSVDSASANIGNLVDDISFEKAYPLTYDANGAQQGTTPQQKQ